MNAYVQKLFERIFALSQEMLQLRTENRYVTVMDKLYCVETCRSRGEVKRKVTRDTTNITRTLPIWQRELLWCLTVWEQNRQRVAVLKRVRSMTRRHKAEVERAIIQGTVAYDHVTSSSDWTDSSDSEDDS